MFNRSQGPLSWGIPPEVLPVFDWYVFGVQKYLQKGGGTGCFFGLIEFFGEQLPIAILSIVIIKLCHTGLVVCPCASQVLGDEL